MAKKPHSYATLSGTLGGRVHVDSKQYGQHTRAKRGTYTPVALNDSMQAQNNRTVLLNLLAKPVHDFLKLYCGRFKHNQLWQQLLQRLRASPSDDPAVLLAQLNRLDINKDYSASTVIPDVHLTFDKHALTVQLEAKHHPLFRTVEHDSYYYEVAVLFLDRKLMATHTMISTEWVSVRDERPYFELDFDMPKGAMGYVVCAMVKAGLRGMEIDTFKSMGMMVVEGGVIKN